MNISAVPVIGIGSKFDISNMTRKIDKRNVLIEVQVYFMRCET